MSPRGEGWTGLTPADLGWDASLEREFAPYREEGLVAGRVAVRHKGMYTILTTAAVEYARIKGYLRYKAETWAELPVVGDWVVMGRKPHEKLWRIHAVLERRTELRRKVKGTGSGSQVLAANIDTVVVVMGLTEDFNLRRLERYLVLIHESGAQPFVLLNKADLLEDDEDLLRESLAEVREIAGDAPVAVASALHGEGLEILRPLLRQGRTLVLVGSSGAGKSTLINALLGKERQATAAVRDTDGRGRHTTTTREMVLLEGGAILIDSPGIREIQLHDADEGLTEAFADIEELARDCRFTDCTHTSEPDCAVLAAIEKGELDSARLDNYYRLQEELQRHKRKEAEWGEKKRRAFRPWKRSGRPRK